MNAADEAQVKALAITEQDAALLEETDNTHLLASEPFRRLMKRYMGHVGLFRTPYADSHAATYRNIGEGDAFRWLLLKLSAVRADALQQILNTPLPDD